jgi:hypothetical protein
MPAGDPKLSKLIFGRAFYALCHAVIHVLAQIGQRQDAQGNRVKERMLNPIEQFFACSDVSDSHGAKL